jgi:hypothetical protein
LERTLAGADSRSYGLAPAAVGEAGVALAAVAAGEAVWLGFQAVDEGHPVTVRVGVDGPEPGAASGPLTCPPDYRLPGEHGAGTELTVLVEDPARGQATIRLLTPEVFTQVTGQPVEPLDRDGAYRGWRLP